MELQLGAQRRARLPRPSSPALSLTHQVRRASGAVFRLWRTTFAIPPPPQHVLKTAGSAPGTRAHARELAEHGREVGGLAETAAHPNLDN